MGTRFAKPLRCRIERWSPPIVELIFTNIGVIVTANEALAGWTKRLLLPAKIKSDYILHEDCPLCLHLVKTRDVVCTAEICIMNSFFCRR